jgi:hypothetical protein
MNGLVWAFVLRMQQWCMRSHLDDIRDRIHLDRTPIPTIPQIGSIELFPAIPKPLLCFSFFYFGDRQEEGVFDFLADGAADVAVAVEAFD